MSGSRAATAYSRTVLEHFRRPRNQRVLNDATVAEEGINPLCGDRIRVQLRIEPTPERAIVAEAAFMANACALCIASASLLTAHVTGMSTVDAAAVDGRWIVAALEGEPPAGRAKCARLPLETLHRALASVAASAAGEHEVR